MLVEEPDQVKLKARIQGGNAVQLLKEHYLFTATMSLYCIQ